MMEFNERAKKEKWGPRLTVAEAMAAHENGQYVGIFNPDPFGGVIVDRLHPMFNYSEEKLKKWDTQDVFMKADLLEKYAFGKIVLYNGIVFGPNPHFGSYLYTFWKGSRKDLEECLAAKQALGKIAGMMPENQIMTVKVPIDCKFYD